MKLFSDFCLKDCCFTSSCRLSARLKNWHALLTLERRNNTSNNDENDQRTLQF
jgi:hypothetical protein